MESKNIRNKIKAVLFDMDGVLVDSEEIMLKSAMIALKRWGVEARPEDFTPFIGAGEVAYLGGVSSLYGVPYEPEMTPAAYEEYGKIVSSGEENIAYPYSADVVRYLKANGYKVAVCTSADSGKLDFNLAALGLRDEFDALITGTHLKPGRNKPHPDIYLMGAEAVGVEPDKCLVVEDAKNGILAAIAAGMMSLGVTSSFDADALKQTGADIVAPTIEILKEIL